MAHPDRPADRRAERPAPIALFGTALFGAGMVGANALVQVATTGPGDVDRVMTSAGPYRLSAVATTAAAIGVLLLVRTAIGALSAPVATAAAGASAAALLLLAGVRYVAPELAQDAPEVAASLTDAATSACAFAAFVALGTAVLAVPGPARPLDRAAGLCCLAGPPVAAAVAAADAGAGYGVAVASTALGVLLVTAWGLSLVLSRRPVR